MNFRPDLAEPDDTALWAQLRTVLARLELISSARIGSYNPGGGTGDGGDGTPPGDSRTAADHFRRRLATVEATERRKLEQAVDDHARHLAQEKAHTARVNILRDATAELEQLTGRTNTPPKPHTAVLDDPGKLAELVLDEGEGHPAEAVALRFKLSEHMVRRIRRRADRDPETGIKPESVAAGTDRDQRIRDMAAQGMSERQIRLALGLSSTTQVRRALGKAA